MYRAAVQATTFDDLRIILSRSLNKYNDSEHSKIDWIFYNIKGKWKIENEYFWFEDDADCMAFICRWM